MFKMCLPTGCASSSVPDFVKQKVELSFECVRDKPIRFSQWCHRDRRVEKQSEHNEVRIFTCNGLGVYDTDKDDSLYAITFILHYSSVGKKACLSSWDMTPIQNTCFTEVIGCCWVNDFIRCSVDVSDINPVFRKAQCTLNLTHVLDRVDPVWFVLGLIFTSCDPVCYCYCRESKLALNTLFNEA